MTNGLLPTALSAAVPLRIAEYVQSGGPTDDDVRRAREFSGVLGERGDVLQFGGKKGEAAELFNRLADAIAVLAFCPGGVTVFGENYRAKPDAR